MNTISITDTGGNTYHLAVPVHDGDCHYAHDGQGYIIAVVRFKPPAPQFTLAPANPTEDEKALDAALEEFKDPHPSRNAKTLRDFIEFCKEAPDLRFWQALSAWCGYCVFISKDPPMQVVEGKGSVDDTFYREGK